MEAQEQSDNYEYKFTPITTIHGLRKIIPGDYEIE